MTSSIKTIICAGGNGGKSANSKWKNYLGLKKHMLPAHGEPIIHRTQRLLLERGFDNIHLGCSTENQKEYVLPGIKFFTSPPGKKIPDIGEYSVAWHYKQHINYQGTTIFLFGDVYYTEQIIDAIYRDPKDTMHWYGRADVSSITKNQRHGEPFAIIIDQHSISRYLRAIKETIPVLEDMVQRNITIPEDLGKYSYRKFCNMPYRLPGHVVDDIHWVNWDDLTDDFDFPEDWDTKAKLFPEIFYV